MYYKKTARRIFKKVRGKAIKRYFKKGYFSKINNIVKDISVLKSMLNSEKKRVNQTNRDQAVGQLANSTGSGHFLLDITPNPAQGSGYNNKTGNSIKLHATHFDFQFAGQTNTVSGIKLKIQIIKIEGLPYSTVTDILNKFILPNTFISGGSIYDINSSRDPDYFKNFKVLRTKYIFLPPDQITGDIPVKQFSMGLKYKNHHVRNNDNDSTLSMGQIIMLITADRGNIGGVNSTVSGAPITQSGTGCNFGYDIQHYFYDN